MLTNKRFLNTPEAAQYIGRHRSTLDKWREAKIILPFYRQGKAIRYDTDDLDRYMTSIKIEPIAYGCPQVSRASGC